ncbi:hypothetical protein [uncultured Eudoraea sp.]|uniref:hypothetical protein n=1 Tax=uncultured Eudoraea sp. TaxID=1035614 RepID=UPI00261116EC|nr:hypothetical protein [uncultured Eudoraea sp.]
MKILHFSAMLLMVLVFGCKPEKKNNSTTSETEQSVPEKIAYAHGLKEWKNVEELKFTFNVDRDTTHFERDWIWNIKENKVTGISSGESTTYYRNEIDSVVAKVDAGFINDKYWLLAPFNLVWDEGNFSYEHTETAEPPIGKISMQKLTIVYSNEGGYTPGDAYDFYFGDDYIIKEWVFRKGNQADASLATTWEDYADFDGLTISRTHKNSEGNFKLYFTNIEVK